MSTKTQKLTKAQSAAIAQQLAGFFFDFWKHNKYPQRVLAGKLTKVNKTSEPVGKN